MRGKNQKNKEARQEHAKKRKTRYKEKVNKNRVDVKLDIYLLAVFFMKRERRDDTKRTECWECTLPPLPLLASEELTPRWCSTTDAKPAASSGLPIRSLDTTREIF